MVPPQFAANAASWDPNRSAGCIGPFPSSPTGHFSEATRKGIPYRGSDCLAPSGSSLAERKGYVLVFVTVFSLFPNSLPLISPQVNKNFPMADICPQKERLFLRIRRFRVGSTQKIVYTDLVEIRQCMDRLDRNIQPAQFIVRICGLVYLKQFCQVPLLQVPVLS